MNSFVFTTSVKINVYDLPDDQVVKINSWAYPLGLGVYHSGVEIDNEGSWIVYSMCSLL